MVQIEQSWGAALAEEFEKDYFKKLSVFVHDEYRQFVCYPPGQEIFNAFNLCPLDKVKVVIIGQDPYHGAGQAEGLCFSVKTGVQLPPSLVNIFKEVKADTGHVPPIITDEMGKKMYDGSLRRWASQGVFLLNATLTVREHLAVRISVTAGNSSPMQLSGLYQKEKSMWCLSCGAAMLAARRR